MHVPRKCCHVQSRRTMIHDEATNFCFDIDILCQINLFFFYQIVLAAQSEQCGYYVSYWARGNRAEAFDAVKGS